MSLWKLDRKMALATAAGVALLALMIWSFNPSQIASALRRADLYILALATLVQLADMLLWAARWHFVLQRAGIRAPFRLTFLINNASMLVNNVTPSARSGGEPLRIYLLARLTGCRARDVASSVVIDRILDYFPLVALLLLGLASLLRSGSRMTQLLAAGVLVLTLALTFSVWIMANERIILRFGTLLSRLLSRTRRGDRVDARRIERWVQRFVRNFRRLLSDPCTLACGTAISSVIWACEVLRTYLVFSSLGCTVPLPVIVVGFTVSMLVGALPLLPGGLGAIEVSAASAYAALGVDRGISAAAVLLDRVISYWMVNAVGLASLLHISRRRGRGELHDAVRTGQSGDDHPTLR
ncbi:MAG: UPF0104 family protein [Euryarchaeota archaeon]